jgi:hypothetical protein
VKENKKHRAVLLAQTEAFLPEVPHFASAAFSRNPHPEPTFICSSHSMAQRLLEWERSARQGV